MSYSEGEGDRTEGSTPWLVPVGVALLGLFGIEWWQQRAQARARHPRRCVCGGDERYLTGQGQWQACRNTWSSGRLVHKYGA
jgi:hypothetical protein